LKPARELPGPGKVSGAHNASEAVKKIKIAEIRLRKSLITKKVFLRFRVFINFFTASQ